MRTQSKTGDLLEARENASEPMGIGFSFVFDWLRWWRQVFGPVTEQSEEKLKQCLLHFFHVTMYYRWRSSIFFFFPFPPISTDLVEKGMRCSQTNHGANKVTSKSFQIIFDAWSKTSIFWQSNPVSVAALRRIAQDRSNLPVSASQPSRLAGRQIGKNLRKRHKRNWRRNFWRSRQRTVRLTRGTHWTWSKEDWHYYRRPFWMRWRENTLQNKRYFSLTVTWRIKDPCFLLLGGVHKQTHLGIVSKKPPTYCSWVWEQKSEPRLSDVKPKPK